MHAMNKVLAGASALALTATMAACSSSGSSSSKKPVGAFKTLSGNTTTVALDPSFLKALTSLKVTPGVIGGAKLVGTDVSFPITGGNATIYKKGDHNPYVVGEVDHNGSGLSLSAGGHIAKLTNFVVDPGNNSNLKGDVNADGKDLGVVKLFDLDGSTLQTPTISSAGIATLTGTTVYLSKEAAAALSGLFGLTGAKALPGGVKTGVKIGVATIKATGK